MYFSYMLYWLLVLFLPLLFYFLYPMLFHFLDYIFILTNIFRRFVGGKISKLLACLKLSSFCLHTGIVI